MKFNDPVVEKEWYEWLNSRPDSIKSLAAIWSPMDIILFNQQKCYVIGYTEEDQIIVTKVNPKENFEEAMKEENKYYLCVKHLKLLENSPYNN
jgi:hypothetical protein